GDGEGQRAGARAFAHLSASRDLLQLRLLDREERRARHPSRQSGAGDDARAPRRSMAERRAGEEDKEEGSAATEHSSNVTSTGTSRVRGTSKPRRRSRASPQQTIAFVSRRAQVALSPAQTSTASRRPATRTAPLRHPIEPSPSSPDEFSPQQATVRSSRS